MVKMKHEDAKEYADRRHHQIIRIVKLMLEFEISLEELNDGITKLIKKIKVKHEKGE